MNDCIFCRIVSGDIPASKVYEDDGVMAFMDVRPVNLGHVLVIPKTHHHDFRETPDDVMAKVMAAARQVGEVMLKATGHDDYNIGINVGPGAGQVVMHTHVHLIPRHDGDGLELWGKGVVSEEETEKIAATMRQLLTA